MALGNHSGIFDLPSPYRIHALTEFGSQPSTGDGTDARRKDRTRGAEGAGRLVPRQHYRTFRCCNHGPTLTPCSRLPFTLDGPATMDAYRCCPFS